MPPLLAVSCISGGSVSLGGFEIAFAFFSRNRLRCSRHVLHHPSPKSGIGHSEFDLVFLLVRIVTTFEAVRSTILDPEICCVRDDEAGSPLHLYTLLKSCIGCLFNQC